MTVGQTKAAKCFDCNRYKLSFEFLLLHAIALSSTISVRDSGKLAVRSNLLNSFSFKRKRVPNKKVKQLGKLDLCINVQIIRLLKMNSRSSERRTANIHSREKEALIKKTTIYLPRNQVCVILGRRETKRIILSMPSPS